ncbi:MAG: tRNA (mnm(5)s(2)U34)-methyltransferase [Oceanipulchritudo sp.]
MGRLLLTELAHEGWLPFLQAGCTVVDATAGNGLDTEFLARAVSPGGKVYAIDIQQSALDATAARLGAKGLQECVRLIRGDHSRLGRLLPSATAGRIRLVCFNLGYRPGGDHAITTRRESTLPALRESLDLLEAGGVLSVMVYRGHPGGMDEAGAVEDFMSALPAGWSRLQRQSTGSAGNPGPVWWLISRSGC